MKKPSLFCRVWTKKYRSYKGEAGRIAPNLLNRDFHAEMPNQNGLWMWWSLACLRRSYIFNPFLICEQWSCQLCHLRTACAEHGIDHAAGQGAFQKIPDGTNLILNSDQGLQYQHKKYRRMIREKGIRQSMSQNENFLDNAVIENFFGLLKSELIYLQEFQFMERFKQELIK